MTGLARQLRWLIGIRLLVITSVALSSLFLQIMPRHPALELELELPTAAPTEIAPRVEVLGQEPAPTGPNPRFLYLLAFLTYLASALYYGFLKALPGHFRAQAYFQFFGDLLLITMLIWHFGVGVSNPFSLLYLMVIALASTLLGRSAGFNIAIAAYCLYAGMVIGLFRGFIPTAPGSEPATQSLLVLSYNLVVHLFAFQAVASLTYVLARRLERAQQVLATERVVHRDIVESIYSGILTTDLEGTITSINRAGAEILGWTPEDLLDRRTYESAFLTFEQWRDLCSTAGELPSSRHRSEVEVQRGDERVFIGFSISPLNDTEGQQQGYIVIFQDLTRWHQLEEEIRIKDRMAAVGELAAGIAHEIGNPLAAISGSVQLLSASYEQSREERKLLDIVLKESQRLDRTIKGFLRFARPRERSTLEFDVAALLAENFELLRNSPEVSDAHRLELDLDPPSVELIADPDQVSQIFWNLARNALKAMPNGGLLKVVGRCVGDSYSMEVIDTGHGMAEKERANLFHPFQSFFDTGLGIGMAIVYRIVQEHGGHLRVLSQPERGTHIRVELPVAGVKPRRLATMASEG